jgi:hypothetical protein
MTDQHPVYQRISHKYAGHSFVKHGDQEYVSGEVHNNTAESFKTIFWSEPSRVFTTG